MDKKSFKSGLFGFNRKDVLQYIDQMHGQFQQQLTAQETRHQDEIATVRVSFESTIQAQQHQLYEAQMQLEEKQTRVSELADILNQKQNEIRLAENELLAAQEQLLVVNTDAERLQTQLGEWIRRESEWQQQQEATESALAEKDRIIDAQAGEITRLEVRFSSLEEAMEEIRVDADQTASLVRCVDMLKERNRGLTHKISRLEEQLANSQTDQAVESTAGKAVPVKREAVQATEDMFATLRKEMNEALDAILGKIKND